MPPSHVHDTEIEKLRAALVLCVDATEVHLGGAFSAADGTDQIMYVSYAAVKVLGDRVLKMTQRDKSQALAEQDPTLEQSTDKVDVTGND